MIQQTPVTIITDFLGTGGELVNGCICCAIADKFNPLLLYAMPPPLLFIPPPLYAMPPPLTPPREGEGNKVLKLNLLPSPLRGGIEGGGIGIKESVERR